MKDLPIIISNLIIQELLPRLAKAGIDIDHSPISPAQMRAIGMMKTMGLSHRNARLLMDEFFA